VLQWYMSRPPKILMTKGRSHMHGQLDLESGLGQLITAYMCVNKHVKYK
jgi:hypothetical protein